MENDQRNQKALELVKQRAQMVFSVIAQLPLEKEEGIKAANLVYTSCKAASCQTKEEEEAFASVFHFLMPFEEGNQDRFFTLLSNIDPKA